MKTNDTSDWKLGDHFCVINVVVRGRFYLVASNFIIVIKAPTVLRANHMQLEQYEIK